MNTKEFKSLEGDLETLSKQITTSLEKLKGLPKESHEEDYGSALVDLKINADRLLQLASHYTWKSLYENQIKSKESSPGKVKSADFKKLPLQEQISNIREEIAFFSLEMEKTSFDQKMNISALNYKNYEVQAILKKHEQKVKDLTNEIKSLLAKIDILSNDLEDLKAQYANEIKTLDRKIEEIKARSEQDKRELKQKIDDLEKKVKDHELSKQMQEDDGGLGDFVYQLQKLLGIYLYESDSPVGPGELRTLIFSGNQEMVNKINQIDALHQQNRRPIFKAMENLKDNRFSMAHPYISQKVKVNLRDMKDKFKDTQSEKQFNLLADFWEEIWDHMAQEGIINPQGWIFDENTWWPQ